MILSLWRMLQRNALFEFAASATHGEIGHRMASRAAA